MTKKNLEGVARKGRVTHVSNNLFSVSIRNHGEYLFQSANARFFSSPEKGAVVKCIHYGYRKHVSVPYKVVDYKDGRTFYDEKNRS